MELRQSRTLHGACKKAQYHLVDFRRRRYKGEAEDGKQGIVVNDEAREPFLEGLLFCCGSLFYHNSSVCQVVHSDFSPFLLHFFPATLLLGSGVLTDAS